MKKTHYATICQTEGLIWTSWPKCKEFLQKNKGNSVQQKGFFDREAALLWIEEKMGSYMNNPFDTKPGDYFKVVRAIKPKKKKEKIPIEDLLKRIEKLEEQMENQKDLVEIVKTLKAVVCVKG